MSAGSPTPSSTVQLSELSMPRLFFHLLRTRFTGVLKIEQPEPSAGTRSVWVRGGMPVFTDWVSIPDSLGELLIARRVIAREQLDGALERSKKGGQPLGQVLLQDGALDPAKLSSALRLQCARKLLHTFALREGSVGVEATESIDISPDLQGQVNVLQLIHRGVADHYDAARVGEEMGEQLEQPMTASKALTRYQSQFGFPREDATLLRSLMRGTSINALSETVEREHAIKTAFILWTCQMLRTGEGEAPAAKPKPKRKPEVVAAPKAGKAPPPPPGLSQPPPPEGALPPPPGANPAAAAGVPAPPDFDSRPRDFPPESHENVVSRPKPRPQAAPKPPPAPKPPAAPAASARRPPASSRAAPEVDEERRAELEAQLKIFEKRIADEVNAFELFDLPLEAGRKEVRGRWAELSKQLHPDTLEAYGLSFLQPRMESVFAAISEAYGVLSNKDERERLLAMIRAGGSGKAGEDTSALVKNALQADMLARDGEKQLRAGRYQPALEAYQKADELNPDDPSNLASIAYCRFGLTKHTSRDADVALEVLEPLCKDNDQIARIHYYIGMVLVRSDGSSTRAIESFQRAYNLDARLVEAQRQLHALQIKKRQARKEKKKKKGGFGGLFGR